MAEGARSVLLLGGSCASRLYKFSGAFASCAKGTGWHILQSFFSRFACARMIERDFAVFRFKDEFRRRRRRLFLLGEQARESRATIAGWNKRTDFSWPTL